jgi:hypothetical protein
MGDRFPAGQRLQRAVRRTNEADVARAQEARLQVLAFFQRRAKIFAARQAENLRQRAKAEAAGTELPPLLVARKRKLTTMERMARSEYNRPRPPKPKRKPELPLLVAVADYPLEALRGLERLQRRVMLNLMQERCAEWGVALGMSRRSCPYVAMPGIGRISLHWVVAWLRRLQRGISWLRQELRWRQRQRSKQLRRARRRRRRQLRRVRSTRGYWAALQLRRAGWRLMSRFWRDQPKVLLPGKPRPHPQPQPKNPQKLQECQQLELDSHEQRQRRLRRLERRRQAAERRAAERAAAETRLPRCCAQAFFHRPPPVSLDPFWVRSVILLGFLFFLKSSFFTICLCAANGPLLFPLPLPALTPEHRRYSRSTVPSAETTANASVPLPCAG